MMEFMDKIKEQAMMYVDLNEGKKSAEEKMSFLKVAMEKHMNENGETKILVPLNEDEDIKVEIRTKSSKKFDKEKIAEDLGVSEDLVTQDFLIKAVEDGKLTYAKYKEYYYREHTENIDIRKVKVGKERKKKK